MTRFLQQSFVIGNQELRCRSWATRSYVGVLPGTLLLVSCWPYKAIKCRTNLLTTHKVLKVPWLQPFLTLKDPRMGYYTTSPTRSITGPTSHLSLEQTTEKETHPWRSLCVLLLSFPESGFQQQSIPTSAEILTPGRKFGYLAAH